jgi:large subunit ribosomal protein L22
MANAVENHEMRRDTLLVSSIYVDEGPHLKRMKARAMGRGNRIVKPMSHITVVVEPGEAERVIKPHGTAAKPRPTFAEPKKAKKKAEQPAEEPAETQAAEAPEAQD